MVEIKLNFKFCNVCKKDISEQKKIFDNLIFQNRHYCSKECSEKDFPDVDKFIGIRPRLDWDGKGNPPNKDNFSWETDNKNNNSESFKKLEEYQGKNFKLINKELVNLNIKKVENENYMLKLQKDIDRLEIEKDNAKEEVEKSGMGKKVILSHPDKCERCDKIDARGNYLRIVPKERGGDDSKDNKIFLCHKCYPIVATYIDDLWEIYNDKKMVRKFVISEDHPLDKVLQVKKI